MRASTLPLLALLAVAAAVPRREAIKLDQVQLGRQKDIVRLLVHFRQPPLWEDLATIARDYTLQPENYQVPHLVEDFVEREHSGELLPLRQPTSVLDEHHVDQIKLFVDLLYYAKDYDTFYKTALFLRERVNRSQFIISFLISVKLRHDTRDFVLPRLYEVYPELFVTSDIIQQVYDIRLEGLAPTRSIKYYILANYTGYPSGRTPEQRLSYFREDVGLNEYFADVNYRYPYFLSASNYTIRNGAVGGDVFYHTLRQLHARYFLERLSHGLPDVTHISYEKAAVSGYNPQLRLANGVEMYPRPEGQNLGGGDDFALERIFNSEYRLSEVVDLGYVIHAKDGRRKYDAVEATALLGRLVQGSADSAHPRYYGALYRDLLALVARYDPTQRCGLAVSALGKYETQLRDPAYFQIVKRVLNIFQQYENHLPPYTREELQFPGLKIESVDVDRLVTYFDKFEFEVDNGLKVSSVEEYENMKIFVRQQRLNHKPFTYCIKVTSDKPAKAVFRAFYGPRFDAYGNELTLDEARQYFFEFDRFVYQLVVGDNAVSRSSGDLPTVEVGAPPLSSLVRVDAASSPAAGHSRRGFPQRLLLPRGSRAGLPLRLYVIASPLRQDSPAANISGPDAPLSGDWFSALADGRAVAFPFDRRIPHLHQFRVPNSCLKDVVVYDATAAEINSAIA